eukprot:COSAG01_NODE_2148_length_8299_cov_283.948177_6_plen_84_part_00
MNSVGEHYTRTTFSQSGKGTTNTPMWPSDISKWMRARYVGANSPLLIHIARTTTSAAPFAILSGIVHEKMARLVHVVLQPLKK